MFSISCKDQTEDALALIDKDACRQDLQLLASQRIYFGHQSVGRNLLQGIDDLVGFTGVTNLRIVELSDTSALNGPFFAHSHIGKNGEPGLKCDSFGQQIADRFGDSLDIAVMKFCYADFSGTTDVNKVFDHYSRTVDSLKSRFPHTTFVHATAPLVARTASWKTLVKSIIGRKDEADRQNVAIARYNRMLLDHYGNDLVFDLAKVESTDPQGARTAFEYEGETAFGLVSDYTFDGGHLNESGRQLAAAALVRTLAEAARTRETR